MKFTDLPGVAEAEKRGRGASSPSGQKKIEQPGASCSPQIRLLAAIARYGYGSLSTTEIEDHEINCDALANEHNLILTRGTLVTGFRKNKTFKEEIKASWNEPLRARKPQRKRGY